MQLFDLHCDSIVKYCKQKADFLTGDAQFSLRELPQFDRLCQTLAVFIPDNTRGKAATEYFQVHLDYLHMLLEKQNNLAQLALRAQDIEQITGEKRCALLLAVESGAVLGGKIENVDYLAHSGVRMITLVWNSPNELGSGHSTDQGLTPFGREVIKRMEEKQMIVDVSHLNDRGFDELCQIAEKPFIATHSNLRSVANHKRNLTHEQFGELARRKGLVGINLHEPFLADNKRGTVDAMYRHIYQMLELGGENVIACGSDFDGADIDASLDTPVKLAASAEYLIKKGISEAVTEKIFYDNALAFFSRNQSIQTGLP